MFGTIGVKGKQTIIGTPGGGQSKQHPTFIPDLTPKHQCGGISKNMSEGKEVG